MCSYPVQVNVAPDLAMGVVWETGLVFKFESTGWAYDSPNRRVREDYLLLMGSLNRL